MNAPKTFPRMSYWWWLCTHRTRVHALKKSYWMQERAEALLTFSTGDLNTVKEVENLVKRYVQLMRWSKRYEQFYKTGK